MKVKLFVKRDCPRCPAAKKLVEGIGDVEVYDIDEVEGLSEAAFHGVLSTPSIVVVNAAGREVVSWRGEVPSKEQLTAQISQ